MMNLIIAIICCIYANIMTHITIEDSKQLNSMILIHEKFNSEKENIIQKILYMLQYANNQQSAWTYSNNYVTDKLEQH